MLVLTTHVRSNCVKVSSIASSTRSVDERASTAIYTLSLHDALPISCLLRGADHGSLEAVRVERSRQQIVDGHASARDAGARHARSEEHTSELQSQSNLVCRLLLEKKNPTKHLTKTPYIRTSTVSTPI